MQEASEAKKPCKGILKTSSSFDRPGASYRKSAKFDELNVLQTYHPLDKDYGHMKIDEPKTPFNYIEQNADQAEELDADLLAEKLRIAAKTQTPAFEYEDLSDDDFAETDDEKVRRQEFERRRKAHYNEFEAVRLARKLMEEELDEDDDEDVLAADDGGKSKVTSEHQESTEHTPDEGDEKPLEEQSQGSAESEAVAAVGAAVELATTNPDMDVDQCASGHSSAGRR